VRGSFQETAPRKTAEHTVKHRDGGVGSVAANHRGGSESLVVVTTLVETLLKFTQLNGKQFCDRTYHILCQFVVFCQPCTVQNFSDPLTNKL